MSKIVNLFGAPGSGKSTTRAGLFHLMKLEGRNVEEVTEYAKDLTWEDRHTTLSFQPYVFAKQWRNIARVRNKVDLVITDSPVLLSYFYGKKYVDPDIPESFFEFVLDTFNSMPSINVLLKRTKKYNPVGRNQTEQESDQIGDELEDLLVKCNVPYITLDGNAEAPRLILSHIHSLEKAKE